MDERLVARARKVAAALGKSLNQLIREYLETVTTQGDDQSFAAELQSLSRQARGDSRGQPVTRDEAHVRS